MSRLSLDALRHRRTTQAHGRALPVDHPLISAIDAVRYTRRQWVHVAAVLTGSAIARAEGDGRALPLMASAGAVLAILTLLLAARRQHERDCAIGVILDGRERIPLAAVARQRRRLLSDRTRQGLANSLENKVREASGRRYLGARLVPVPCDRLVVSAVADEIVQVAQFLRRPNSSARGVARAERLIERALSPLYGRDIDALREELSRVRELLAPDARETSVACIETARRAGDE
jgi:hypothetical protein